MKIDSRELEKFLHKVNKNLGRDQIITFNFNESPIDGGLDCHCSKEFYDDLVELSKKECKHKYMIFETVLGIEQVRCATCDFIEISKTEE